MRLTAALIVTCAVAAGASVVPAAEQNHPLPAFDLVSQSGAAVSSGQLSAQPRWLMIYVAPACVSCERLMSAIAEWQPAIAASRIVVVVQAAPDVARTYAQTLALDRIGGLTWYVDAAQAGSRALGIQHLPALVGVENGRVAWTLTGVLNDPRTVESVVKNWTGQQ